MKKKKMIFKKRIIFICLLVVISLSLYIGYSLNVVDPSTVISVTTSGETAHGNYILETHETNLQEATSGYLGRITVSADDGYYVKNVSATYKGEKIDFGFEAGAEQGNYFRKYNFHPLESLYEFIIPDDADTTPNNQVKINIEYAEKTPFNISYMSYKGTNYDEASLSNPNNYNDEVLLVEGYKDGDLVLPKEITDNGSVLLFKFSEETYNEYKSIIIPESGNRWFRSEAVVNNKNYIESNCDDTDHICYVSIDKDFKNVSYGKIELAYTKLGIYTTEYVGFNVETDVDNFNDIIAETGSSTIGFTKDKLESSIELFYGTRVLTLTSNLPKAIIKSGNVNNCGTVKTYNNVTGSGYGYNVSYNNGKAIVSINTFYQDELVIELNILKDTENVIGNPAHIVLNRFAFAGNGGQLLEVDEHGRNCNENNNGNTCNEGIYYSTQYRGVLNFMYIKENEVETNFTDLYRVDNITNNTINVSDANPESGYKRNKDFNPHAIALFYDQNDVIVGTKDIDLNREIDADGFMKKEVFNSIYSTYTINKTIDKDYVMFDHDHPTLIKNLEYFGHHTEETIMHDIVFISKQEVEEKEIKKIGLFLVNGEIDPNNMPALTYGIGKGRIMEIHGGDE